MLRVCNENDREILDEYLKDEPYGRVIISAVREFGFARPFQTVYVDEKPPAQGGGVRAVYLWFYKNLVLYAKENHVEADFLEEMMGISAPRRVAGRRDNVNIVSWLLTDYEMENGCELPEIMDENGEPAVFIKREEHAGEWSVLTRA